MKNVIHISNRIVIENVIPIQFLKLQNEILQQNNDSKNTITTSLAENGNN